MVELSPPERSRDRGQVGIETLVIFIAMILVAAVAAGVLINTAGFLQNQASSTSQESQEQVSNQVIVISATGTVNGDPSGTQNITDINLTVMQSPGAGAIDLAEATIQYIGPDGEATLIYNSSGASADDGHFHVSSEKDEDNSVPVLNEGSDRFNIQIELAANANITALDNLEPGESATITIVTQSGSQYTYIANVPETLASHDTGEAVSL